MPIDPREVQWDETPQAGANSGANSGAIDVNAVQWDDQQQQPAEPAKRVPQLPAKSEHPARKYTRSSALDQTMAMAGKALGIGYAFNPDREQPQDIQYDIPTNLEVAQNAIVKGAASVPDLVLNTPTNIYNLGKAAFGTAASAAGRPDLAPDITPSPDLVRGALTKSGAINPAYEPQTQGQKYLDVGLQGATGGLLTGGSGGVRTALANTLAGGTGAISSQVAADQGYSPAVQIAAGLLGGGAAAGAMNRATGATKNVKASTQNALVDEGFAKAKEAGFIFPPSQSNPGSVIANTVDVLAGGRPRMQQAASIKNQAKVNELAAKTLGLEKDTPITPDTLKTIRNDAVSTGYEPIKGAGTVKTRPEYNEALDKLTEQARKAKKGFAGYDDSGIIKAVEQLRTKEFDAESGIAMIQQLRDDASGAYTRGDKSLGRALKGAAGAIEDEIEAHLAQSGDKTALNTFKEARKTIAKTYSVEKALNEATGNISATKLARQLDKGVPLSGELRDIALAAKLPGASLADTKYATTGASQLEGLAALGGAIGTQNPLILAAPIARGAVRSAVLTKPVANMLGTPNYKQFGITPENRNALAIMAGLNAEREQ